MSRSLEELEQINADLLQALEDAVGIMKLQRDVIERGEHAAAWNPVIAPAEAAIQKARG